jgi:hypothetical protein
VTGWDVMKGWFFCVALLVSGAAHGSLPRHAGNLLTIQETLQGQAPRTETRRYDRFDRLEHAQNVYGKTVDYTYDAVGNRTTLRDG